MDMRYLEFMSHLSNIRQMRYTSFVIGNFFKKVLVTKVSCPKLLVTLKMMDVRQNVNVILHARQLSFQIRVLHTQLKSKCRNFKNSIVNTKKSFLYYLYKLLLYSIYFNCKSNKQTKWKRQHRFVAIKSSRSSCVFASNHTFVFLQLSSVILQSKGLFKYS